MHFHNILFIFCMFMHFHNILFIFNLLHRFISVSLCDYFLSFLMKHVIFLYYVLFGNGVMVFQGSSKL